MNKISGKDIKPQSATGCLYSKKNPIVETDCQPTCFVVTYCISQIVYSCDVRVTCDTLSKTLLFHNLVVSFKFYLVNNDINDIIDYFSAMDFNRSFLSFTVSFIHLTHNYYLHVFPLCTFCVHFPKKSFSCFLLCFTLVT